MLVHASSAPPARSGAAVSAEMGHTMGSSVPAPTAAGPAAVSGSLPGTGSLQPVRFPHSPTASDAASSAGPGPSSSHPDSQYNEFYADLTADDNDGIRLTKLLAMFLDPTLREVETQVLIRLVFLAKMLDFESAMVGPGGKSWLWLKWFYSEIFGGGSRSSGSGSRLVVPSKWLQY